MTDSSSQKPRRHNTLRFHAFDVGHGDSLLLEFPGGRDYAIIDCCRRSRGETPRVLRHLLDAHSRRRGGIRVLFAALTHPDRDHIEGYGEAIESLRANGIPVEWFWTPPTTEKWARVLADRAVEAVNNRPRLQQEAGELAKLIYAARGIKRRQLQLLPPEETWRPARNPNVEIRFLAPHDRCWEKEEVKAVFKDALVRRAVGKVYGLGSNLNFVSACFRVSFGKMHLLLTGDMMSDAWQLLIDDGQHDVQTVVLKVPHHGSRHSNFLKRPKKKAICEIVRNGATDVVAIISGGYRKSLPHRDTLRSLSESGYTTYVTGKATRVRRRPFAPASLDPNDADVAKLHFKNHFQLAETLHAQAGNVVIDCRKDGRWQAETSTGSGISQD